MGSQFNPFSGLLEPLARGSGSDGVIFAKQLGGGEGEGNCVDDGQRGVRVSSFNLSHVRTIDVASASEFLLADCKFLAASANIESKVLRNIHDFYVYVTRHSISTD